MTCIRNQSLDWEEWHSIQSLAAHASSCYFSGLSQPYMYLVCSAAATYNNHQLRPATIFHHGEPTLWTIHPSVDQQIKPSVNRLIDQSFITTTRHNNTTTLWQCSQTTCSGGDWFPREVSTSRSKMCSQLQGQKFPLLNLKNMNF